MTDFSTAGRNYKMFLTFSFQHAHEMSIELSTQKN